jgi:hypothetical protein
MPVRSGQARRGIRVQESEKGKPPSYRRLSKGGGKTSQLNFTMQSASSLATASLSTDWEDPIDFDLVKGHFKLGNLDPRLPAEGVDLRDVMPSDVSQGRNESWEEVRLRAESYARSEFGHKSPHPYRSISQETRLLVGTLALPEKLLQGTFKRLLGEMTDIPTTWQVRAVAFALFNPPMAFWGSESWADVCHRAEMYAKRRERITAQVRELLALGE